MGSVLSGDKPDSKETPFDLSALCLRMREGQARAITLLDFVAAATH